MNCLLSLLAYDYLQSPSQVSALQIPSIRICALTFSIHLQIQDIYVFDAYFFHRLNAGNPESVLKSIKIVCINS